MKRRLRNSLCLAIQSGLKSMARAIWPDPAHIGHSVEYTPSAVNHERINHRRPVPSHNRHFVIARFPLSDGLR